MGSIKRTFRWSSIVWGMAALCAPIVADPTPSYSGEYPYNLPTRDLIYLLGGAQRQNAQSAPTAQLTTTVNPMELFHTQQQQQPQQQHQQEQPTLMDMVPQHVQPKRRGRPPKGMSKKENPNRPTPTTSNSSGSNGNLDLYSQMSIDPAGLLNTTAHFASPSAPAAGPAGSMSDEGYAHGLTAIPYNPSSRPPTSYEIPTHIYSFN
jgi:hypothetical protein